MIFQWCLWKIFGALFSITSKAYGGDNITVSISEYCSPHVDTFTIHIINCCTEKSYFSLAWKVAIELPLCKISNPVNFSDLRIISILHVMSKIFEIILYKQIYDFALMTNIISTNQYGFRKGFSTE